MRWFRGMAMVLVGIMLLTISGSAFAAVKDDTVSPLYLYTRKVKASLTISDSGKKRLEKDAPKKKRFCSEKCRIKWWAEHPEQLSNAREHQYKCPVCCKVFYSYKPAKFCSLTCYHRSRRKAGGKDA